MARFESIDDYLASLDPPKGETLRSVIDVVLDEFPELECQLAWDVPQFRRGSDYVLGLSAHTRHLDASPWSAQVIQGFRERLEADGYGVTKHLFKFPVDWEVDRGLLVELVNARLAELA